MVSQTAENGWDHHGGAAKTGSLLSLDGRQRPSAAKTPPSYYDAVRSRHSLSQPVNKPQEELKQQEKTLHAQQVKYNSLPRPLPQRYLQTNGHQPLQPAWSSASSNGGHLSWRPPNVRQEYDSPPKPANHVPLQVKVERHVEPTTVAKNGSRKWGDSKPEGNQKMKDMGDPRNAVAAPHGLPAHQAGGARPPPPLPRRRHTMSLPPPQVEERPFVDSPPRARDPDCRGGPGLLRQHCYPGQSRAPPPHTLTPPQTDYDPRYSKAGTLRPRPFEPRVAPPTQVALRTGPLGTYPESDVRMTSRKATNGLQKPADLTLETTSQTNGQNIPLHLPPPDRRFHNRTTDISQQIYVDTNTYENGQPLGADHLAIPYRIPQVSPKNPRPTFDRTPLTNGQQQQAYARGQPSPALSHCSSIVHRNQSGQNSPMVSRMTYGQLSDKSYLARASPLTTTMMTTQNGRQVANGLCYENYPLSCPPRKLPEGVYSNRIQEPPLANRIQEPPFANRMQNDLYSNRNAQAGFSNGTLGDGYSTRTQATYSNGSLEGAFPKRSEVVHVNRTPEDVYSNRTPEASYSNGTLEGSYSKRTPEGTYSNGTPESVYPKRSPEGPYSKRTPAGAFSNGIPESGNSNRSPEAAFSNRSPESGYPNRSPEGAYSKRTPEGTYANGTPESGYLNRPPEGPYPKRTPAGAFSNEIPESGYSNRSPEGAFPKRTSAGAFSNGTPESGYPNRSPEGAYTKRTPTGGALSNGTPESGYPNRSPEGFSSRQQNRTLLKQSDASYGSASGNNDFTYENHQVPPGTNSNSMYSNRQDNVQQSNYYTRPIAGTTNGYHHQTSNNAVYENHRLPAPACPVQNRSPERDTPTVAPELPQISEGWSGQTMNSYAKELVKPKPRMPRYPNGFQHLTAVPAYQCVINELSNLPAHQQSFCRVEESVASSSPPLSVMSGCYELSPDSSRNGSAATFKTEERVEGQSCGSKLGNGQPMRKSVLSSSTASLCSEASSVSSRRFQDPIWDRMNEEIQKRRDKGSVFSASPWEREEKEKLQREQVVGARRARDREIAHLEAEPERSERQEEWLRILRLEREFQRRAEQERDDDEDDESDGETSPSLHLLTHQLEKTSESRDGSLSTKDKLGQKLADSTADSRQTKNEIPTSGPPESDFEFRFRSLENSPERYYERDPHDGHGADWNDSNGQPESSKLQHNPPVPAPRPSKSTNGTGPPVPLKPAKSSSGSVSPLEEANQDLKPMDNSLSQLEISSVDDYFCPPPEALDSQQTDWLIEVNSFDNTNSFSKPATAASPKPSSAVSHMPTAASPSLSSAASPKTSSASSPKLSSAASPKSSSAVSPKPSSAVSPKLSSAASPKPTMASVIAQSDEAIKNASRIYENVKPAKTRQLHQNGLKPVAAGLAADDTHSQNHRRHLGKSNGVSTCDMDILPTLYASSKVRSNHVKDIPEDIEDKSPEFKKIWISRPEKLSFQEKIRKFSLQAGDDDVPRDRVKNSKAQREIENKFSLPHKTQES